MGCSNQRETEFNYNYLDENGLVSDGTGPFYNTKRKNYKDQYEKLKDGKWITKLNHSLKENAKRNCCGYRKNTKKDEFEPIHSYVTYEEVDKLANNFAVNCRIHDLVERKKYGFEGECAFLGLFARNCTEWVITDIACQRDSVTSVTFYSTLGDKAFEHIFEQTECRTVCVSNCALDNLLKYHKQFNFKSLQNVVIYDLTHFCDEEMFKKVKDAGLNAYSFKDLIKDPPKESEITLVESNKDTIFTICYTSGTTSLPKGAKITQNNFYGGSFAIEDSDSPLGPDTVHISYLPLAHIMERICIGLLVASGGLSCFIAASDVKKYLAEDILISKPTVFVAVPRVLTMFHQIITAQLKKLTGCAKTMADRAYAAKKANFEKSGTLHHGLYDKLVFSKIRNKFGGQIKYFITGSAPLPMEVGNDMKLFFSAPIVEAYGMTEITGALTLTSYFDSANGMAGGVMRTCEMKLADRKEMNYHSKTLLDGEPSPTGEICCRGINVFPGYFLDKEKTEQAFDKDGWLLTGDVGRIMPNNKGLKIIDRVKELFKLSQGEYIAPSKLENVYIKNKYILQLCVYGNSLQSYLIGIISPNKPEIKKFLLSKGIMKDEENPEDYYENKELHAEIKSTFDELAKTNGFNSLEKPMKFILSKTDFTIQNELITPTMKLVRNKIADFFKNEIDECYKS